MSDTSIETVQTSVRVVFSWLFLCVSVKIDTERLAVGANLFYVSVKECRWSSFRHKRQTLWHNMKSYFSTPSDFITSPYGLPDFASCFVNTLAYSG